ncbi:MAG: hypothetical protein EOP04_22650 [Proteobacteria bacterium]|nr:MAG: hypothetical protein EOP04_22650 [Pseudomonadota bacterium]
MGCKNLRYYFHEVNLKIKNFEMHVKNTEKNFKGGSHMKILLVALTLLIGCGVDKVEVNCHESACIEIPDPTTEPVVVPQPTIEVVEPAVVVEPVVVPRVSPVVEASYQIKFMYKVTSRRTLATDYW